MDRRTFISLTSLTAASRSFGKTPGDRAPFKIGITDWGLKATCDPKAFQLAKECGLDGIQLSFVPEHKERDLTKREVLDGFIAEAKKHEIEVASMAMGVFNGRPFATTPKAEDWVSQCFEIMVTLKQKVVLLAFFGKGDLKNLPDQQKLVIERLKKLAPLAEKKGIQIGLETWLNKEEHMSIIDGVGSEAVKVYYDTANMTKMGYDIHEEMRWLAKKDAICQVHMKEVGNRLGEGEVDFPKVKETLASIDYKDWLIIESGVKDDWKADATKNGVYLNKLFNQA